MTTVTAVRSTNPPSPRPLRAIQGLGYGVAVIVDGENLRWALRDLGNRRINIGRFIDYAVDYGAGQVSVDWFMSASPSLDSFSDALTRHGVQIHRRRGHRLPDGTWKCEQDADIAACLMDQPPDVGTVLLVTGDGDFTGAAHRLLARGIRVVLLAHQTMMATAWREALPQVDRLDLATQLTHFEH